MEVRMKFKHYSFLILLLIVVYLFWGPLFPWSPVKIGYEEFKTDKAVLYIKNMATSDSVIHKLEEVIQESETWHDLQYQSKFKIVVLDKNKSMKRFIPWAKTDGYSISLGFGNLIYIGGKARQSEYGIEPYIKRELSQLLLHQNTPTKGDVFDMHEQEWLVEGVATYFGGPDYYTQKEFAHICIADGAKFSGLNEINIRVIPIQDLHTRYAFYKYFIQFLIESYGLERMQKYIELYLRNPSDYKGVFQEVYGEDLETILEKFDYHISMFRWQL